MSLGYFHSVTWTNFAHGWSHFYHVEIEFIILTYKLKLQKLDFWPIKSPPRSSLSNFQTHSQTFKLTRPSQNHSQTFKLTHHSQNHSFSNFQNLLLRHPNQSLSQWNTLTLKHSPPSDTEPTQITLKHSHRNPHWQPHIQTAKHQRCSPKPS